MLQITNAGIVLDWLDCASWMDGVEQRLGKIPTREPLQRLMAGGIAGAFSRTGTSPACCHVYTSLPVTMHSKPITSHIKSAFMLCVRCVGYSLGCTEVVESADCLPRALKDHLPCCKPMCP